MLQDLSDLTVTSKHVICMRAMGLVKCSEVESKLKGFIAETNKRHLKGPKPFSGHAGKSNADLLDILTAYFIAKKLVIISYPEPCPDGTIRLNPPHVTIPDSCT